MSGGEASLKYDFDQAIDRTNTGSTKWDMRGRLFGQADALPMWVADMDLPCPAPVVEAIRQRAEHPIYGYTAPSPGLYDAIVNWCAKRYGWQIKREWIVFTAGVVNGLVSSIRAQTRPGDEIIVQPPVYYPFAASVRNMGGQVVNNPLKVVNGRYEMDIDGLRELFRATTTFPARTPKIKMMVLCSPHNPVGRVWSADDLRAVSEICLANDCVMVSDEIHCDLTLFGNKHTATASLGPAIEQNTITLMAASKTFNIAGLSTSFAIIPNDKIRRAFMEARAGDNSGNIFGRIAIEAALTHADDYLEQLLTYIEGNFDYFCDYIAANIPQIKVGRSEATYLAWVDMRGLGLGRAELQSFVRNKAKIAVDDGYAFGEGGEGFERFNLGCPRSTVEEAVRRLEQAVKSL